MDVLDEELIRFWRALNDNGVRYIMVGGFATRFHGFNRTTDDLDLWLEDTLDIMTSMKGLEQFSFDEGLTMAWIR